MAYYVYMLRCGDGSLYTGSTWFSPTQVRHTLGWSRRLSAFRPAMALWK